MVLKFVESTVIYTGENDGELNDLLHKERVFRTRETVLRANVKDFSNIFKKLESLKNKRKGILYLLYFRKKFLLNITFKHYNKFFNKSI